MLLPLTVFPVWITTPSLLLILEKSSALYLIMQSVYHPVLPWVKVVRRRSRYFPLEKCGILNILYKIYFYGSYISVSILEFSFGFLLPGSCLQINWAALKYTKIPGSFSPPLLLSLYHKEVLLHSCFLNLIGISTPNVHKVAAHAGVLLLPWTLTSLLCDQRGRAPAVHHTRTAGTGPRSWPFICKTHADWVNQVYNQPESNSIMLTGLSLQRSDGPGWGK